MRGPLFVRLRQLATLCTHPDGRPEGWAHSAVRTAHATAHASVAWTHRFAIGTKPYLAPLCVPSLGRRIGHGPPGRLRKWGIVSARNLRKKAFRLCVRTSPSLARPPHRHSHAGSRPRSYHNSMRSPLAVSVVCCAWAASSASKRSTRYGTEGTTSGVASRDAVGGSLL